MEASWKIGSGRRAAWGDHIATGFAWLAMKKLQPYTRARRPVGMASVTEPSTHLRGRTNGSRAPSTPRAARARATRRRRASAHSCRRPDRRPGKT